MSSTIRLTGISWGLLMNSFCEHHKGSIRWQYRCFDRILLNGLIQPFQQPKTRRRLLQYLPATLSGEPACAPGHCRAVSTLAEGVVGKAEYPGDGGFKGRRDDFVEPYFKGADPDAVVIVLKAREPARIMTAIGDSKTNRWHLQIANRWVVQYNFYINDQRWGRMFVRICPYLPFSARVCLNQHHWLANRMREEGIEFEAMRQCLRQMRRTRASPATRQLAHPFGYSELRPKMAGTPHAVLYRQGPAESGCRHRLFFSQVEFCDNLIFRRRAALDKLGERLLDESHDRTT